MKYIVLDFEWNQPLSRMRLITEPVKLVGEIIQIGAVKLNSDFMPEDEIEINVKPSFYTTINEYVSRLTGITEEDLENSSSFPDAIIQFLEWCGDDCCFITWGPDDMSIIRSNMKIHNINPEILPKCYNLQLIFNKQITGDNRQWALSDAMEKLNLPIDLTTHDAKNDAVFTARICSALDMKKGISEYVAPIHTQKKPKRDKYFIIERYLISTEENSSGMLCKQVEFNGKSCKILKRIKLKNRDKLAIIDDGEKKYLLLLKRVSGFEYNINYTRKIYDLNEKTENFYNQQVKMMRDIKNKQTLNQG